MKNSTYRKLRQLPTGSLLVGIDPHKKRHAAVVMSPRADVITKFKVDNSLDGFIELCERVDREVARQKASDAVYAIEAGAHYWRNLAYFLSEHNRPFRMINPFTLKRRREGEDLDRRKNDFRDATMAAELLRTGKFTDTKLPEGVYAELRAAYHAYQRVQAQVTRSTNLVKSLLDGLFPEFCQVFKKLTGMTALAVLDTCSEPATIAAMSSEELVDRVRKANRGKRLMVSKVRALHAHAHRSAGVKSASVSVSMEIGFQVDRLRLLGSQLEEWREHLSAQLERVPESRYLLSISGIGVLTVAGMLGELGPLSMYTNAKQLVKMAGTNPTESESAGKRSSHSPMSKKGRSSLRWCLWAASVSLLRHNRDFAHWAKGLKERAAHIHPLKPREAIGAVCNRLLRVSYALAKTQTIYHMPQPEPEGIAA